MAISFACKCGKKFRVKEEHAGKQAKCPQCGAKLTIPQGTMMPPDAEMQINETNTTGTIPQPATAIQHLTDRGAQHASMGPHASATKLKSSYNNCPYCGEQILSVAKKCKNCGEWLDRKAKLLATRSDIKVVLPYAPATDLTSSHKNCPYCGEQILSVAKKCKHCGEWLDQKAKLLATGSDIKVVPPWNIPFFLLLTMNIYCFFWLYRVFKELHGRDATRTTPGKAVGFTFIPFFNIYWLFAVFFHLEKGIEKAYIDAGLPTPPTGLVWAAPIGLVSANIVGFVNVLAGIFMALIAWSVCSCSVQSWMNRLATERGKPGALSPSVCESAV